MKTTPLMEMGWEPTPIKLRFTPEVLNAIAERDAESLRKVMSGGTVRHLLDLDTNALWAEDLYCKVSKDDGSDCPYFDLYYKDELLSEGTVISLHGLYVDRGPAPRYEPSDRAHTILGYAKDIKESPIYKGWRRNMGAARKGVTSNEKIVAIIDYLVGE